MVFDDGHVKVLFDTHEVVVHVLLVDHPRNTLPFVPVPLAMFVVLLLEAAFTFHVGKDMLPPVQVIEPFVLPEYGVPESLVIIPVPPFLSSVMVIVHMGWAVPPVQEHPDGHDLQSPLSK